MYIKHTKMKLISNAVIANLSFGRRYSSSNQQKKTAYYHNIGKKPLVYRTLGEQLDKAVEKFPNTKAIISCHEKKSYTFSTLKDEVDRLAAGFIQLGLKIGDPIGIWAPNYMHWYLTMLAAAKAGLPSVGINPAFQGPEVDYCLKKVEVKAIVAPHVFKGTEYYNILAKLCPEMKDSKPGTLRSSRFPHLKTVIINSDEKLPGVFRFHDILNLGDNLDSLRKLSSLKPFISADSPCNIQFTSGSTGKPKATVLSHLNVVNNGILIGSRAELGGETICVQVPLFHAFGVTITISAAMSCGATMVLPAPVFKPEESLKAIANEQCTVVFGTPTMYVDLIQKQKEFPQPIESLKKGVTGGAPCSPQLFRDMKKVLGLDKIKSVFGLTETTSTVFLTMPDDPDEKIFNSVGHVLDHTEAKVIDEKGNIVFFGEPGELCIRGHSVMLEYFKDEEKTKEILGCDKWLKTGDQFILQEDGYGKIVGRLKEMIIRGGENIFPKEIEDILNTHPDIIESYVIGVEDERMGEEVCAFVRLQDGVKGLTQMEVKEYFKGKIAHFKIPRYVKVVTDFPKTTSGKIQKFKLKDLFVKKL
ncbi:medium-chain acyl-CoA ligase ACSF2, mitochondrial-like [Episyrphus balteatus]|uniref:medium-chain acyl-CoA ligase ACSF2, mitochondrial-like n=1 Tax=Episyrphus balteatus TaxID=286459 RepID=UPI002486BBC7|nr:medium-chain acyl-CoA ligase ACSF2, mitochondrial-like [Episyrphus balteatus]